MRPKKKIFNEKKFSKIIDFCIDKKICNFDTSDNYFNGKIEKILGSRIKKSSNKIKILNKFRLINDIEILKKNLINLSKILIKITSIFICLTGQYLILIKIY